VWAEMAIRWRGLITIAPASTLEAHSKEMVAQYRYNLFCNLLTYKACVELCFVRDTHRDTCRPLLALILDQERGLYVGLTNRLSSVAG